MKSFCRESYKLLSILDRGFGSACSRKIGRGTIYGKSRKLSKRIMYLKLGTTIHLRSKTNLE